MTAENHGDDMTGDQRSEIAAHMPGPWQRRGKLILAQNLDYVCEINFPADDPEVDANARLIAAAPELLAAARDWLWLAEGDLHEFDLDVCESDDLCLRCKEVGCINLKIRLLRAAIAKATGTERGSPVGTPPQAAAGVVP